MSDSAMGIAAGQIGYRHAIELDGVLTVSCISSQAGQIALVLPAIACDPTAQPRRPRRIWPKGRP